MCSDSVENLIRKIEASWPAGRWLNYRSVIAVSGGADSVALLRALILIRDKQAEDTAGSMVVAHFNHKLRGDESELDAKFVEELARTHGLSFYCGEAKEADGPGSENEFRDQRYEFLRELARSTNSRYIVTAHHQDDQIETVLFRLFRGTGLRGLCGIPATRVVDESISLLRPMLDVDRETIESALHHWKQEWRSDATNAESQYSRNFIRNEVLPLVRKRFGSADRSVARLARQAQEHRRFVEDLTEPLWDLVHVGSEEVVLNSVDLVGEPRVLLRELVMKIYRHQDWPISQLGFADLDRVVDLLCEDGDVPAFQLPGGIDATKRKDQIRLIGPRNDVSGCGNPRD